MEVASLEHGKCDSMSWSSYSLDPENIMRKDQTTEKYDRIAENEIRKELMV